MLHAWGGQPLPLNASCWLEEGGAGQHVRLRGARAAWRPPVATWAEPRWTRRMWPTTGNGLPRPASALVCGAPG